MNKIEIIKSNVKMADVLGAYWTKPNWAGRYKCVFHNGVDYNMGINDEKCHCFVCGATGDVLDVVQTIFNITLEKAISKLDFDFHLGLNTHLTAKGRRELAKMKREAEEKKRRRKYMRKFEKQCLGEIAEKLKKADEFILEKAFKGDGGSEKMFAYADSPDFALFKRAIDRKRWLEWLWNVITEDSQYMLDEDFVRCYGTDRVDILRKIYAKKILI